MGDACEAEDLVEKRLTNMRRCTAQLRDMSLLRGTTSATLLDNFGCILKSTAGGTGTVSEGEDDFMKSYAVQELDIFLSHSWHACWWMKYLTLLYYFNALPATLSALFAALLWCTLQQSFGCEGILSWRGFIPGSVVYFVCLFSWHHIRAMLRAFRVSLFLDKVCINQKDPARKAQGINAIGGILNKSHMLLVAWDRTYFTRLWCSFELAAFYHSKMDGDQPKGSGRVVLLPIILGRVTTEIAATTWVLELLRTYMGEKSFGTPVRTAALFLVSVAFAVRFHDFLAEVEQLKAELAVFSAQNAQCFCCSNKHLDPSTGATLSCDRALVNASIAHWYGDDDEKEGLATFDELIRGRFREEVGEAIRGARMPYQFVLVASVWPALHQLDYISQKPDADPLPRLLQCIHIMFLTFPLMFAILMGIMRAMAHLPRFKKGVMTATFSLANCSLHWAFVQLGRRQRKDAIFCLVTILIEVLMIVMLFQEVSIKRKADKFAAMTVQHISGRAMQIELMPVSSASRQSQPSRMA
mmetsp:Transcript_39732/g.91864  ORF Transcript_39732/g.91864 Transcript_39732/m.91864 type:complete len:526 (+) Transcript_39732:79-1656(+)